MALSPRCMALAALTCASSASLGQMAFYTDPVTFLAATGASSATGPLPDLGLVGSAVVGSITFRVAPGGDNLAIGGAGVPGLPAGDWYPETPGNDLAMGYENLLVEMDGPVYSMGFEFNEPDVTMPAWGSIPQDSTYEVTLYDAGVQVGQFTFNAADDVPAFVGVWSAAAFDSATIVDVTGGINVDDDEYFGEFFTGVTPLPPVECYANCDGSTSTPLLTANDFQCFLNEFAAQSAYANCDGSTVAPLLTANDFQCFLNKYAAGCS